MEQGPSTSATEEVKEEKQKSGKRIRWHEGDKFTHEFDDSHLWAHGRFAVKYGVEGIEEDVCVDCSYPILVEMLRSKKYITNDVFFFVYCTDKCKKGGRNGRED